MDPRATIGPYLRTDGASFLSERQRIVSFSAFQSDSASPRFVSAHTASRDPPVTLSPLHLASGGELLACDAKPPVRGRTDSGRCRNDRVAQVLAVDVTSAPKTVTRTQRGGADRRKLGRSTAFFLTRNLR